MAGRSFLVLGIAAAAMGLPWTTALAHWGAPHWGWGIGPWMLGDWGVWGWFHFIAGSAIRILFIVGLIFALCWLVRAARGDKGASRAMEILKERYARGEIAKEEFERMRRDLLA